MFFFYYLYVLLMDGSFVCEVCSFVEEVEVGDVFKMWVS